MIIDEINILNDVVPSYKFVVKDEITGYVYFSSNNIEECEQYIKIEKNN